MSQRYQGLPLREVEDDKKDLSKSRPLRMLLPFLRKQNRYAAPSHQAEETYWFSQDCCHAKEDYVEED